MAGQGCILLPPKPAVGLGLGPPGQAAAQGGLEQSRVLTCSMLQRTQGSSGARSQVKQSQQPGRECLYEEGVESWEQVRRWWGWPGPAHPPPPTFSFTMLHWDLGVMGGGGTAPHG